MRNEELFEGVGVRGANLQYVISGFGGFTLLASRILAGEELGEANGAGMLVCDPERWYSLNKFLHAVDRIGEELGDPAVQQVGGVILKNALLAPWTLDLEVALSAIDVAYHLNHGLNGKPMYSYLTGEMKEGIGHYSATRVPDKNEVVVQCTNPYPCAFDHGVLKTLAQRLRTTATVVHDPSKPCRKADGNSCTFVVSWH